MLTKANANHVYIAQVPISGFDDFGQGCIRGWGRILQHFPCPPP